MKKNQVYILCRKDGKDVALNIKESLEKRRYTVFLDIDSETELTELAVNQKLEECIDFIPILTKDAWVRLSENDSYVKKIETALADKNVVPIFTRGVVFPSAAELDDCIKDLANRNGLPDSTIPQCFEGIMDRLDTFFLNSHRKFDIRTKYFFYTASIISVLFITTFSVFAINSLRKFPTFKNEKDFVDRATTYFSASMSGGNYCFSDKDYFNDLEVIYELVNDFMLSDSTDFSKIQIQIKNFKEKYAYKTPVDEKGFLELDNTKLLKGISYASFNSYVEFVESYNENILSRFELISDKLDKKEIPGVKEKWMNDFVNLKKEIIAIKSYKYHFINYLLSNVDYDAKDKNGLSVLQNFLTVSYIPNSDVYWETSKQQAEILFLQDKKNLEDIWSLIGRGK